MNSDKPHINDSDEKILPSMGSSYDKRNSQGDNGENINRNVSKDSGQRRRKIKFNVGGIDDNDCGDKNDHSQNQNKLGGQIPNAMVPELNNLNQ